MAAAGQEQPQPEGSNSSDEEGIGNNPGEKFRRRGGSRTAPTGEMVRVRSAQNPVNPGPPAEVLTLFLEAALADRNWPEAQRRAWLMREVDGLDYKTIAAALGQPVNTVKSHIFRARDAIAHRVRPLLEPTRDRRW